MGSQRVEVTFTFTLQELEVGGKWACGLRFLGFFFFKETEDKVLC